MEKFTEDLNIIRSLPDNPALTSDEFRSKFDEAGKKIKEYINNILGPEVESKAGETELTQLNTKINTSLTELEDAVNQAMEDFTLEVNRSLDSISSMANNKTSYEDLVVTQHNVSLQTNIQFGRVTQTQTINNSGYKPLAIVGTYIPYDYNQQWTLEQYRITNSSNGSGTVSVTGQAGKADGNKNYSTTVTLDILWIKVR